MSVPPGHCENPGCKKAWATLAGRTEYQQGVADGRAENLEALKALHARANCCTIDEADCPFAELIRKTEKSL